MNFRNLPIAFLLIAGFAPGIAAQTDYYNSDAGRPVRIEDAHPTERYAFELVLPPVTLERRNGGDLHWEIAPEIAYGILPRTHVEIGFPIAGADGDDGGTEVGLAGVEITALHNLNVETTTLPAFALAADLLLPMGGFAPDDAYASVTGIATRTFSFARIHANARYTFGAEPTAGAATGDVSRWLAGVALDRALPLRALLLIGDVYAEGPLRDGADVSWVAEAGVRYQLSPFLTFDAGIGRRLIGAEQGWTWTFGVTRALGFRALIPVAR